MLQKFTKDYKSSEMELLLYTLKTVLWQSIASEHNLVVLQISNALLQITALKIQKELLLCAIVI